MLYNWEPSYLAPNIPINKRADIVQMRESSNDALLARGSDTHRKSKAKSKKLAIGYDTTGVEDWYYDYSGM